MTALRLRVFDSMPMPNECTESTDSFYFCAMRCLLRGNDSGTARTEFKNLCRISGRSAAEREAFFSNPMLNLKQVYEYVASLIDVRHANMCCPLARTWMDQHKGLLKQALLDRAQTGLPKVVQMAWQLPNVTTFHFFFVTLTAAICNQQDRLHCAAVANIACAAINITRTRTAAANTLAMLHLRSMTARRQSIQRVVLACKALDDMASSADAHAKTLLACARACTPARHLPFALFGDTLLRAVLEF